MSVTIAGMAKKTEQIRIPVDLANDARIVASALGTSLPQYVTDLVQQAVRRDLPKAAKIVSKRASQFGSDQPPPGKPAD
jgi:hypothetical protein